MDEFLLPGVVGRRRPQVYLIHSARPLCTLSSAVVGGGLRRVRYILNRHVAKGYRHPAPAGDLRAFARRQGIVGPFVGLLTAAYVQRAQVVRLQQGALQVSVVVTAGLSNATAAGLTPPWSPSRVGTINTIVLVDARLTPAALVNAALTATEAKVATLLARGTTTPYGPATGTSTDALVIACTGRDPTVPYAGPVTPVGWLIARGVRQALAAALEAQGW